MNINDVLNKYEYKCKALDELKAKKVEEFSATIKNDLDKMFEKNKITRSEVAEYLNNLKAILKEKEADMDMQIRKEKELARRDVLSQVELLVDQATPKQSSVELTTSVLDNSFTYFEDLLNKVQAVPVQQDDVLARLSSLMVADEYVSKPQVNNVNQVQEPSKQQEQVQPVAPAPVQTKVEEPEEDVSTVELEKMLAEFENLI